MKKVKIIFMMMALFMTVLSHNISASGTTETREEIRTLFPNNSTAQAVANSYTRVVSNPLVTIDPSYKISNSELEMITDITYTDSNPITFVDSDLTKLKKLAKLNFENQNFSDLSGIGVLSDRLISLVIDTGKVTDLEPLKFLSNLKILKINWVSQETNDAIQSDPDFFKPLEGLTIKTLTLDDVNINNHHTEAISKITSLEYLTILHSNLSDLTHISKLVNLKYLDVKNNKLTQLKGFDKLVNLDFLYAGNNYSEKSYNQINDFSDIVFPITSNGHTIINMQLNDNRSFIPLTIEYVKDDKGISSPLYYIDLNNIILPKSSPGYSDIKMEVTMNEAGDRLDLDKNRLYIDKAQAEGKIVDPVTGEFIDFEFKVGSYKFLIPGYKNELVHQGLNGLWVNTIEIKGDIPATDKVQVDFVYNNGQSNKTVKIDRNTVVSKPTIPFYDEHVFDGWYTDSKFTKKWNFLDLVKEDMTLYAKWVYNESVDEPDQGESVVKSHKLVFDSQGGTKVATQYLADGDRTSEPSAPSKEGFNFKGWYVDKKYQVQFQFNEAIEKDTVVYAKWVKDAEVLPNTGVSSGSVTMIATSFIGIGFILVITRIKKKEI